MAPRGILVFSVDSLNNQWLTSLAFGTLSADHHVAQVCSFSGPGAQGQMLEATWRTSGCGRVSAVWWGRRGLEIECLR